MTRAGWRAGTLAVVALACFALGLGQVNPDLDALVGLALTLVLPGVGLVGAADPFGRHLGGLTRLFWILIASLGTAALGGLILNLLSSLTQTTWVAYLASFTLMATGVWWWRGRRDPGGSCPPRPRLNRAGGLAILGAGFMLAAALGLSVVSNSLANRESFVQLWLLPRPFALGSFANQSQLGLTNYENRRATFLVRVTLGSRLILARSVTLAEGATWTTLVTRSRVAKLEATVALKSSPERRLASAYLDVPVVG